jgi:histone-lysine N-methyltransferase SUV420H
LQVYYWTTIRKNRGGRFSASRGLHEEDIADIIRKEIVLSKDLTEAVQQLLRLPGLRKFVQGLKDEKERDQFTRHLRRYASIYMPDCPFEVTTTNRYTITDHEASVTARRDINPREEIKYLTGVQVAMTEEQEKTLELARKDFSLVISSRKKTRSLFLGPARFANHDCDANAKLSTKGYDGMQIVAVKHIEAGDEITVSYGEDYFGDDNEECLCQSCENRQVNGWAPFRPKDEDEEEEDDEDGEGEKTDEKQREESDSSSLTGKRKRITSTKDDLADLSPASKKLKVGTVDESTSPTTSPSTSPFGRRAPRPLRQSALKKVYSISNLRKEVPISSIEDPSTNLSASPQVSREFRIQQRVGLLAVSLDETASTRETTPQSSIESKGSPQSTDATSIDEDQPVVDKDELVKPAANTLHVKSTLGVAPAQVKTEKTSIKAPWATLFEDDSSSELSELSPNQDFDDVLQKIVQRKKSQTPPEIRATRSSSRHVFQVRASTPIQMDTIEDGMVENKRKPGDYMKSAALVAHKYSKWVECHTCDDFFVQQDGYLTRKDCPRCERHSKLYGFAWPKTDREGKHDKEERILDHRTVHRFVDPDEERVVKKKVVKKALKESMMTKFNSPRFSTPRSDRTMDYRELSTSEEAESPKVKRRSRKTM